VEGQVVIEIHVNVLGVHVRNILSAFSA
jgi:hypothetical protein